MACESEWPKSKSTTPRPPQRPDPVRTVSSPIPSSYFFLLFDFLLTPSCSSAFLPLNDTAFASSKKGRSASSFNASSSSSSANRIMFSSISCSLTPIETPLLVRYDQPSPITRLSRHQRAAQSSRVRLHAPQHL